MWNVWFSIFWSGLIFDGAIEMKKIDLAKRNNKKVRKTTFLFHKFFPHMKKCSSVTFWSLKNWKTNLHIKTVIILFYVELQPNVSFKGTSIFQNVWFLFASFWIQILTQSHSYSPQKKSVTIIRIPENPRRLNRLISL